MVLAISGLLGFAPFGEAGDFAHLNTTPAVLQTATIAGTPIGVVTDASGHVIVATSVGTLISVTTTGTVLGTTTLAAGSGTPVDIAMNDVGDVYVVTGNGTIQRFNFSLTSLATTTLAAGSGTPVAISADNVGTVYIATSSSRIFKRNANLGALMEGTVTGTPTAIAVMSLGSLAGDVYVTTSGGTVHRLNTSLATLASGTVTGTPIGVAGDDAGNIIVATSGGVLHKVNQAITVLASRTLSGTLVDVDLDDAGHVVSANQAGTVFVANTGLSTHTSTPAGFGLKSVSINLVGDIYAVGGTGSGAPDATIAPTSLAFGAVTAGTPKSMTFTVTNSGTATLNITATTIAATTGPAGVWTISPAVPPDMALAPGASQPFTVTLSPPASLAAATPYNATITIASNDPAQPSQTILASGTGMPLVPAATLSTSTLSFGLVNAGGSSSLPFTVTNSGTAPLSITSVTVTPTTGPATVWTINPVAPPANPLPPGGSQPFMVTLGPPISLGSDTPYNATITLVTNDPTNPTQTITTSGTGHVPAADFFLDPTVTNLAFGDLEAGYRMGQGVRVVNRGDLPLTFTVQIAASSDSRFSFSQTPEIPGPGVRGPLTVTIPASPLGGPFNSQILRATFDALLPVGANFTGMLRISGITNDPTPPTQPIDIMLSGNVVAAKTLDVALVLDRSGSMSEAMAIGSKIEALRNASQLFFNLMRDNVGDRAAIVQYNAAANTLKPITAMPPGTRQDFIDVIANPANLVPNDVTSIAAGLINGFAELNDPNREIRAALVVTDGLENTPAQVGGQSITLSNIQVPAGIAVHSLCLGTEQNTDKARLAGIAMNTGGSVMATDNTTQLGAFGVEKYFLKVATNITGGTSAMDPVSTIHPGQTQTWQVPLIPADKSVTFVLMFKNGGLPFKIIAPDGAEYPAGSPPNGFAQSYNISPNSRVVRIQLPVNQPSLYAGNWRIEVTHAGKLQQYKAHVATEAASNGPVTYAVAVSVHSNLRLLTLLSPQPLHPGDPITVTAFLSEEEVPVRGATIDAQVRLPDASTWGSLRLFDDGQHNDGAANDGQYANVFTATQQTGAYTFNYHATGHSARGGAFTREDIASQYVQPVNPPRGGDDPKDPCGGGKGTTDDRCCAMIVLWLRIIAILALLILLVLIFRRQRSP